MKNSIRRPRGGKGGHGEKDMNERKRTNLKALFIILAAALILAFVYLALPKERSIERRVDATLVRAAGLLL